MLRRWVSPLSLLFVVGFVGIGAYGAAGCGSSVDLADKPLEDGGGPGGGTTASDDAGTTPEDCGLPTAVSTLLKNRCQSCHGPTTQFGAPMSLVTYDDLMKPGVDGKKIYERMQIRIHQEKNPMPPSPLSAEESKVFDDWVAAGAPRSTDACATQPATDLEPKPLQCDPDEELLTIKPANAYPVSTTVNEEYACVGVDLELPAGERRHITKIQAHLDKKDVVHHVLLMQSLLPVSTTPYSCAGVGTQQWKLVAGWTPGADPYFTPAEAGFPYDSTTHWVIQTHYNNAKKIPDLKDTSGFDVCVTKNLRKYDAGIVAFGSMAFVIPPRSKFSTTCSVPVPPVANPLKLFRAWPHMHTLGYAMKTVVKPADGGPEKVLVDDQNFSFQNQISFPADVDVKTGDIITTTCRWNNTTDSPVSWGENTVNEMCYNYTLYYPVIGAGGEASLNWMTGSANPACISTIEK